MAALELASGRAPLVCDTLVSALVVAYVEGASPPTRRRFCARSCYLVTARCVPRHPPAPRPRCRHTPRPRGRSRPERPEARGWPNPRRARRHGADPHAARTCRKWLGILVQRWRGPSRCNCGDRCVDRTMATGRAPMLTKRPAAARIDRSAPAAARAVHPSCRRQGGLPAMRLLATVEARRNRAADPEAQHG